METPILNELKKEIGDKVRIIKVDPEKNHRVSADLGIGSIPTLKLYYHGKNVWTQSGVY